MASLRQNQILKEKMEEDPFDILGISKVFVRIEQYIYSLDIFKWLCP